MRAVSRAIVMSGAGLAFAGLAGFVVFASTVSRYTADAAALPPTERVEQIGDDGIVVLTGGTMRVKAGLRLFEQVQARRILISGAHRLTTRDLLRRQTGLPETLFSCCVDVGYAALDTSGNAAEARDWAETWGFKRLRVVTSNYHMPRSLLELGDQLPRVALLPHPVLAPSYDRVAWWTNPEALRIVAIEYVKSLPVVARIGFERTATWMQGGDVLRGTSTGADAGRAAFKP